ncbi:membrane-anchored ubiquitin-fold protein 2-like [Dorcoceras hygrometricum]|uniref:Membrane-anchored ubiquitin-fold protein 2-like n=1 Tax=Dorcoceras hygrometricum TaxID=472368 RepID=A0A2Z7CF19_9LAMI|nr:membrane-anchored ubiquitin-fold protein 2-like [Dorcoceras hygrometricum]
MSGAKDQLEIKFRLIDGTDIGPKTFAVATSVATLKENVIAQWPKDKQNGPRAVKDVKLICAGRILENNKTVGECMSPLCDIPGGATTMLVVVQPPQEKDKVDGICIAVQSGKILVDTKQVVKRALIKNPCIRAGSSDSIVIDVASIESYTDTVVRLF